MDSLQKDINCRTFKNLSLLLIGAAPSCLRQLHLPTHNNQYMAIMKPEDQYHSVQLNLCEYGTRHF